MRVAAAAARQGAATRANVHRRMLLFDDIVAPSDRALEQSYGAVNVQLDVASNAADWSRAFADWDDVRRTWASHANLTRVRYSQDTRNAAHRDAQTELDRRIPSVIARDAALKRRFLGSPQRASLEQLLGAQAFALWDADIAAFDPKISDDLVRESNLARDYTELLATASVTFEGEDRSLGGLGVFLQSDDRTMRHAAELARWRAFSDRAEELDALFDELVRVRDRIARTLGFANFVELGYKRMHRVDYDAAAVARYRSEIESAVVPFAAELIAGAGKKAGLGRVHFWDEGRLGANTTPRGNAAWILDTTREAFAALDPALGEFATFLLDAGLLDVENRPGKALGAYCTQFPTRRVPFVFANFNGSRSDVRTLTHELGHAFAAWRGRETPVFDYLTPTYESAEIHSMSLEFLAWPAMERYFGDGADAYRREHLADTMLFLPYAAAIDAFQHWVYENPAAKPAERNAMWLELEKRFLPWRDYGDLAHPLAGGLWQEKRHVYVFPFYYIDYALAQCCALQFWNRARTDEARVWADFVNLCGRGGAAPFGELVRSAGLESPFAPGVLAGVVSTARATLG